jgi:UDP-N-acetylglucosamine 1-carboxyvinyltransferase
MEIYLDKFTITGGKELSGRVKISGAKNSSLALMPATLLNSGINIQYNTPEVNDIFTMIKLLRYLGVEHSFDDGTLTLDSSKIIGQEAPYEHVKKMRASVYVLGPLLTRYGYAKVSLPGGCAWGPRPINLHLESLKKMGADIQLEEGYIIAKAKKLNGALINFDISSVGATGNVLMAAVLAKGQTTITNAATEPEICQLAEYLISMGAKIEGVGTATIEIDGVDMLYPANVKNICDRIEAGTLLVAGAVTKSKIEIEYADHKHFRALLTKLEDSGAKINIESDIITLDARKLNVRNVDITTSIYPGFPTDMQAQWAAYMCLAGGTSTVTDNIYLDRFNYVPELNRLGADIEVIQNSAVIKGVKMLKGAKVMSTDLRASASLVIGGLAAEGVTEVLRIYHLDRGYQRIEEKLSALGADIKRESGAEY